MDDDKNKDLDERIVKTRFCLTEAIIRLLKKQAKLKVLDICKEAGITPMTYYHHFDNKVELLEYTINDQLENKLPIPRAFKPTNIKQLIAYLLKMFDKFIETNKELVLSAISEKTKFKFHNSYLDLLLKICNSHIAKQLDEITKPFQKTNIEIWSSFITYGLIGTIVQRKLQNRNTSFSLLWNAIKQMDNSIFI